MCEGSLGFEILRCPSVVGIEKSDKFAAGVFDSCVSSGGDTAILPRDDADARVGDGFHLIDAAIGAAVIDNNDFLAVVGLSEHGGYCLRHETALVV